tara:strand:+ start:32498 stop:32959 length:462 start_codon:yes stop_codon:yes gene_type:complete
MSSWSDKYKRSIDCSNPKGFSQKAHCAGRKKRSLKEAGRPYSAKYMKELLKAGQGKTADTVNVKIPKSGHFMDEETLKKEACWDSHKQVGFKMKKGKRVPNCVPRNEDAPVNSVGGGKVAGLGVGPQGEPGVPVKRKKKKLMPFIMYMKRKNV